MTYNKKEKAKFGSYRCWGQISAALFLFSVGMVASRIEITICGKVEHGYFVAFPCAAMAASLSLIAIPSMDFEYLDRSVNWAELKAVVFDVHYIVVLFISFYCGWCFSFQYFWEYWYIDHLSGGPVLLALAGIIRRPFVALWFLLSEKIIHKLGDVYTMAFGLFIFAITQMVLSFIHIPWLVLIIDIFQSAAFALSNSPINVHLSKAGSNASSTVILALGTFTFGCGIALGSSCTGFLFVSIGPRITLFSYAILTAVIFVLFFGYIHCSNNLDDYEMVADNDNDCEDGEE